MNDELELWTVRVFDDASSRIALPPRGRWLPANRTRRQDEFTWVLVAAGVAVVLLAAVIVVSDPARIGVGAPRTAPAPTAGMSFTPSPSESAAWGMVWSHADGAKVLRPTWLPSNPGEVATSVATGSRGLIEYGVSYIRRGSGLFNPSVAQVIFVAETLEAHEPRLIQQGGVPEQLTVLGQPAELVGNAHGAWQLSWTEGTIRYAIQTAVYSREDLLRIAQSLRPVIDDTGRVAPLPDVSH